MMITLRLYRQHDLDLITLYRHPSFSLSNAIKKALCAYVRNESFYIEQPVPYDMGKEKVPKIVQIHIQLPDEDNDAIEWIKGIKEGYRNSVLKNVVRGYIAAPCVYTYIANTQLGIAKATELNELFKSNIKETTSIKARNYVKSFRNKKDNKKVEDSELAKTILSGKKEKTNGNVFIENVENKIDTKKLEEITKKETVVEEVNEAKSEKEKVPEIIEEKPAKPVNTTSSSSDDSGVELSDMIDDFDKMMEDF